MTAPPPSDDLSPLTAEPDDEPLDPELVASLESKLDRLERGELETIDGETFMAELRARGEAAWAARRTG